MFGLKISVFVTANIASSYPEISLKNIQYIGVTLF